MLNRKYSLNFVVLVLGTLMVSSLAVGPASALEPHVRDGWLVGISYGYSEGNINWAPEGLGSDGYGGGATPQIRVGKMMSPKFALGLDYNGWMLEDGEVPLKIRSSLQSVSFTGTWYPGKNGSPLGGFYLRGGAGYAWASLTFVEIDEEPPEHVPLEQEHGTRQDESGLALSFQIGYEFRLSRDFAAGLGLGYNHLAIGKEIYDSAYYFPVTLTGIWYF